MTQTDKQREAFEKWVKTQEWKSAGEATMANRVWQAATAQYDEKLRTLEQNMESMQQTNQALLRRLEKLREVRDIIAAHYAGTAPDRPDIVEAAKRCQSVAVPADKWLRLHASIKILNEILGE